MNESPILLIELNRSELDNRIGGILSNRPRIYGNLFGSGPKGFEQTDLEPEASQSSGGESFFSPDGG
jgi:hypothetical protein